MAPTGVARAVHDADHEDDGSLGGDIAVEHAVRESPHTGPSQAGEPVNGWRAVRKGPDAGDHGVKRVGEVPAQCGIDPRVAVTDAAQIDDGVLAEDNRHSFGHSSRRTSSHARCAPGCLDGAEQVKLGQGGVVAEPHRHVVVQGQLASSTWPRTRG